MKEMYFSKEFITKDIADRYLCNNPLNRTIKKKVECIKHDLMHGNFVLTHQAIALSEDNELIDGQHRLTAISETGIPAWMWVCHNAPRSAKIDRGTSRTDREALYMAGDIDKGTIAWNKCTFPLVSFIIQRSFNTSSLIGITEENKYNVYLKFKELIDPIISLEYIGRGGKIRSAIVFYSMLCALNSGIRIETIKKWYQILSSGDFYSDDHEELIAGRGILILRNYLNTGIVAGIHPNDSMAKEVIGKIMTSIKHYNDKKEVKQIKGAIVFNEIIVTQDDLYGR